MNPIRRLLVVALAVVLLFSLVAPLSLADVASTGEFDLANTAPVVSVVQIYSEAGLINPVSSLTPQVQYWVKVTVADGNTITDVTSINLQLFYNATMTNTMTAPATADNQTNVIIGWTKAGGTTATLDQGVGGTTWSVGTLTEPADLTAANGDWVFPITIGKVATQTSPAGPAAVGQWDLYAQATDAAAAHHELYNRAKAMLWYGEVVVNTPSIDFGSIIAGSGFADNVNKVGSVSVTYISNGVYTRTVKSDATWTGTGAQTATLNTVGTPAANEFSLRTYESDTFGSSKLVTTTDTDNKLGEGTITIATGTPQTANTWWLKVAALFTKSTYSGAITYMISN